jgi:hypothetical protein
VSLPFTLSCVHPETAPAAVMPTPGGFKAAVLSRLKVTRTIFGANASSATVAFPRVSTTCCATARRLGTVAGINNAMVQLRIVRRTHMPGNLGKLVGCCDFHAPSTNWEYRAGLNWEVATHRPATIETTSPWRATSPAMGYD